MAEKKNKSAKSSSSRAGVSINKVAFFTICAVAILYLVSMILGACGISLVIIGALQGVATAVLILIVSVLAWRYIAKKQPVWIVLYVICLLVVILGIVLPLVLA